MVASLTTYLLSAFLTWTAVPDCVVQDCASWERVHREPACEYRDRLALVSQELATTARVHELAGHTGVIVRALTLAALAFEESALAAYVDDGTCNDPRRRSPELARGGCDGGKAFTIWQIQPARGMPTGPELLDDRLLAAQVAWSILERRPAAWSTFSRANRRQLAYQIAHPLSEALPQE